MRLKILFIVGLGLGYVLGARAGRPRYEQIKSKATEAWEDPRVQKVVTDTQEFVKENAPRVQEKVVTGTKAAVASAQDTAARASAVAKDVSGKLVETTKDVSDKIVDTTKDVSATVAKSSKRASKKARETSKKVSQAAHEASDTVSKTVKTVRDRIIDRGEDVVDGAIIAVGRARGEALAVDADDEEK
jgi:hypothetical protein